MEAALWIVRESGDVLFSSGGFLALAVFVGYLPARLTLRFLFRGFGPLPWTFWTAYGWMVLLLCTA